MERSSCTSNLCGHRVALLVLGDIGRSPRMQYHALSLLACGADLSIIAYAGEDLVPALASQSSKIDFALFSPFEWPALKRFCWPIFAAVKAIVIMLQVARALLLIKQPSIILVQVIHFFLSKLLFL